MSNGSYSGKYTWSHPYGKHCLAHTDGAISCMVEWSGVDVAVADEKTASGEYQSLYAMLHRLKEKYWHEFHLWRENDPGIAEAYDLATDNAVRGGDFAKALRDELSTHYKKFAMSNTLGIVFTHPNKHGILPAVKTALKKQGRAAEELLADVNNLVSSIPGARVVTVDEYKNRIIQSFGRARFSRQAFPNIDPRFLISEQVVHERPTLNEEKGVTSLEGVYTKTLYVRLYPDAGPGWVAQLAALPIPLHIVTILKPADTRAAMKAAERQTDAAEGLAGRRGRDYAARKLSHLSGFRQFVVDNGLAVYRNAYIIQLHHHDLEFLEDNARRVCEWIETAGGQARDAAYLQLPWMRYAQPGQGYRCPLMRPDHTWQVANMLPVQRPLTGDTYKNGQQAVDSMRLRMDLGLVGFNFLDSPVPHYITSAMTRAGKGVDAVTTIAELYPLDIDFCIAEVGECYRWLVEGYGGNYTVADPAETAVNPLPAWRYVQTEDPDKEPLPPHVVGSTATGLAYLVTGSKSLHLDDHQRAALETALQSLYLERPVGATDDSAPLLPEVHTEMDMLLKAGIYSAPQAAAAKSMIETMDSFFSTAAGQVFMKPDNLTLSEGITGVDLGQVEKASPQLLKFYLIFISLRMMHQAMATYRRAYVWLDEVHYFVKHQPEIVGQLCSELPRMGGKKNAFLGIVTQELTELEVLEPAVINNMPMRNLLYRTGSHDEVIKRLGVPGGPAAIFKGWPNPVSQNWRPGLRTSDKDTYHNLYLSFPRTLLALAESSPRALELKAKIGAETSDPFERLERLMSAL